MASAKRRLRPPVRINRDVPGASLVPFTDHFQGFERVEAVRRVFGDDTERVLAGLKIGFIPNRQMFMGIRDKDGNLAVGTYHLKNSPARTIYLDVVHELFHIGQRMKNGKFFHDEFMKFIQDRELYYASPIEVPAYNHTVREAERIGMTRDEIVDYLRMGDPPAKTWRNFLKEMRLSAEPRGKRVTRFPVKINREVEPSLHRFQDYFLDFEKAPAIREIFGESTEEVLRDAKIEFIDSPWPTIYASDEDGHLIVATDYIRRGSVTSLYLEVLLGLHLAAAPADGSRPTGSGDSMFLRPASLKAYSAMVREARRLGLRDPEILELLALPSFMMSRSGYGRFLKELGLGPGRSRPAK